MVFALKSPRLPARPRVDRSAHSRSGLFLSEKYARFSDKKMGKHAQSIDSQVTKRITSSGRGSVFTPGHFLDLGSRAAIDQSLSRQAHGGILRKIARGLYHYPRLDPKLGEVTPATDNIARALQGSHGLRLQPSGAHAANLLGLSDQVPVRAVFLTDGRTRRLQVGKRQIVLRRTTPRQMATAGRISGSVIQALRWLGQRHVSDATITTLRTRLSSPDKRQLLADIRYAPAWIADVIRKVASPDAH